MPDRTPTRPLLRPQAVLALCLALAGCGGGGGATPAGAKDPHSGNVRALEGRPVLVVVARDGDGRGAVAMAVRTGGIAPDRGAQVAVGLAALVEARLEARGVRDVEVIPGWDGYRVRALAANPAEAAQLALAFRAALLSPVNRAEADALAAVNRKLDALARRPMADAALLDAVRCTGEAFGFSRGDGPALSEPTAEDLERWRGEAHSLGRTAFATAGREAFADAVAEALARGGVWPNRGAAPAEPLPSPEARPLVYDGAGEVPPGGARVTMAAYTESAAQAVGAAALLGDPHGPLVSRLGALEAPGKLRTVTANARASGGCVALTFDLAPRDLTADASGRVATAVAIARQELRVGLAQAPDDPSLARTLAQRAGDPREAAERAAWWALSRRAGAEARGATGRELRVVTAVGLASTRDAPEGASERAAPLRRDLDRAIASLQSPVVEARTRVERGQGEAWILFASTCGTGAEGAGDAGAGALVARAAAERARRARGGADAEVEAWATVDGIGLVVHGGARRGESAAAHIQRLADLAARSFAADPLEPSSIATERAALLGVTSSAEGRMLGALAAALTPGHPSWIAPIGTVEALGRMSDTSVMSRASALRAGPLRVAVLANVDEAQAETAVRAVDRWIARRPGDVRACSPPATPVPARAGTYAVEVPSGAASEALLAWPLPPGDDATRAAAQWMAAALGGPHGLLARALGESHLARSWDVRVLGSPEAGGALVVRVVASDAKLDGAVAQTRALFDRLRQGALDPADYARARAARERAALEASLDPRSRVVALWRGERPSPTPPTLDALRAFASARLRDDALVIVAARPPKGS